MFPHFSILALAFSILSILPPTTSTSDYHHCPCFEEVYFKALAGIPDAKEYLTFLKQYPHLLAPAAEAAKTNPLITFAPSNQATRAILDSPDSPDARVKRGTGSASSSAGALMAVGQTGTSRGRRGLFGRQVGPPADQSTLKTVLTDPTYVNLGPGESMRIVSATNVDPKTGALLTTITAGLGDSSNITSSEIQFPCGTIRSVNSWFTLPITISRTLTRLTQTSFLHALTYNNLISALDSTPKITIFVPIDHAIHPGEKLSSCICNHHVLEGVTAYTPDIVPGQAYKTKAGTTITITVKHGKYYVNDALITQANVITKNGVVHFVDRLVAPGFGGKEDKICHA